MASVNRIYRLACALIVGASVALAPLPSADAFGPPVNARLVTAESRLRAEFERFAAMTDGSVGVAVRRLSDGETIMLNGNTLFPMASTYKVAVAGTILSQIDKGALTLDAMLPVESTSLVSSDGLASFILHPGASISVYNLLELMLTRSDNSATDILVKQAGGPQAITAWLRAVGVDGQRVDDNTEQLLYRAMGISPTGGTYRQNVDAALAADQELRDREWRDLPNIAFAADPRDTSTPEAMIDLLTKISAGQALSPASTAVITDIMGRCRTGEHRLKALLPPGTPIIHKTGTLNGLGNDVGIVGLPDGTSFAIAVFVMKDSKGKDVRDRIMAEAARAAYDYFLFANRNLRRS